jgi:hypothetical protein
VAGPVTAFIRDARTGEVAVMHGTNQVVIHDPDLVARLTQTARSAS